MIRFINLADPRVRAEREQRRDRGDTMLFAVILVGFLLAGTLTLVNASDAWGHRRGLQSVAEAASRAAAQITEDEVQSAILAGRPVALDVHLARSRAALVVPEGFSVRSVDVDGLDVSVTITGVNEVPFPGPAFGEFTGTEPDGGNSATATATAAYGLVSEP